MTDSEPGPDTDELPSPVGSDAPAVQLRIPGPPGMPRLGPDEATLPPGSFTPTGEPSGLEVVTAVRNAVREELDALRAQIDIVNDPNAGVMALLKSLEESLKLAAESIANFSVKATTLNEIAQRVFNEVEKLSASLFKHSEEDRDQFADHERRLRELERWRASMTAGQDDGK